MTTSKINFETYIKASSKKEVYPDIRISKESITQMNLILNVFGDKIGEIASGLCKMNGVKTLDAKSVEAAVKILMIDASDKDFARDITTEGLKAVTRFTAGGKGSKAERAGIIFPPSRANELLHSHSSRVSETAGVYLAAALQAMCVDIMYSANENTQDMKRLTITPKDMKLRDTELEKLFKLLNLKLGTAGYIP